MNPTQCVILCGGIGSRLRPYTDLMPKPMVSVDGRPFLEYLLKQISAQGLRRFLLLTGYLGEQIQDYFGDGSSWGWDIEYSHGPVEWDTGRRIWEARGKLDPGFLLAYSDNFAQFQLERLVSLHRAEEASITLLLAPKTKGNIRLSATGRIEAYDRTRTGHDLDFVEIGYMLIDRDKVINIFPSLSRHPHLSFSDVLQYLAGVNELAGVVINDVYHSISDPDRLELTRSYLKSKKVLLIDRDGVINEKAARGEYITSWNEFKWVPETRRALKELALRGFKFIVISNQAGVARGMISSQDLQEIHQNMSAELRRDGIEILGIYFCPHHWDDKCKCRKPAPGLFFQASRDHLLRLDHTIYVGDDQRDCLACDNAGCLSVLVGNELKNHPHARPTFAAATMFDAVPWVLAQFQEWEDSPSTPAVNALNRGLS